MPESAEDIALLLTTQLSGIVQPGVICPGGLMLLMCKKGASQTRPRQDM